MALPILGIAEVLGKVIDNVVPDPDKKMELQLELAKLADGADARESAERIAQAEVNKQEAAHSAILVAGWRPAAGWTAVGCIAYVIVVAPLTGAGVPAPENMSLVRDILLGMLGISVGARSIEKLKGVAENTLAPELKANAPIAQMPKPKKKGLAKLWPF